MTQTDYDLIIIGAGPCGLACAIEAAQKNINYLVLEKGNITEAIRRYPLNMKFFSTAENIEIGNLPLIAQEMRPSRTEALKYYRRVALHYQLNIRPFTPVDHLNTAEDGSFRIESTRGILKAKFVIIATGYYDLPRLINVPGEDLPHVSHYYDEPYRYSGTKVVVVGGANSAVETALDLYRNHAEVSLVHMFPSLDSTAKYWIKPDLDNRIKKEEVKAYFEYRVERIEESKLTIRHLPTNVTKELEADFVFLMTGYRPDAAFLQNAGIELQGDAYIPVLDPHTYETSVPGLYMAGSVIGGEETAKVFIENGKLHAAPIIRSILKRLGRSVT